MRRLFLCSLFAVLTLPPAAAAQSPCTGPWLHTQTFAALPHDARELELKRLADGLSQGCLEAFNGLGYLTSALPKDYPDALRWFRVLLLVTETQHRQVNTQSALLQQFLQKVEELHGELQASTIDSEALKTQMMSLRVDLANAMARRDLLDTELRVAKDALENARIEIIAIGQDRSSVSGRLAELDARYTEQSRWLEQANKNYASATLLLNSKISELEAVNKQLADLRANEKSADHQQGQLRAKVAELQHRLEGQIEIIRKLEGLVVSGVLELQEERKKGEGLVVRHKEAVDATVSSLRAEITEARMAAEVATEEANSQQRRTERLQADIDAHARALAAMDMSLSDLSQARSGLDAKLQKAVVAQSSLEAIVDKLMAELREREKVTVALDAELSAVRAIKAALSTEFEAEKQRRVAVEEKLAHETQRSDAINSKMVRLQPFVSEFLSSLRDILGGQEGISVQADRFIIQSEILFASGSFELSPEGQRRVESAARMISELGLKIPHDLPWAVQITGHTDREPVRSSARLHDNWELSTRRALTVLRMLERNGVPAMNLVAAGHGEHRPVATGMSPEEFARNRRIELKLTN